MTRPHLCPCPGCSRHVRVSDATCPFCSATLDASFRASPRPVAPSVRLSRAALVAFGSGTLSLAAACGGATTGVVGPTDAGPDTGVTAAQDSGEEDSGFIIGTAYGAVIPEDSGAPDTGTTQETQDAGTDAPDIQPPYGAPPYGLPP
jgi:hypothetical protein